MPTTPLIPKIPPLRTDIQEPQQSSAVNRPPAQGASNGANTASNGGSPQHRTSKEWYYYWSKVGEQVVENTQKLNNLVTYGTHAARPDPSTMPDGALYVEDDRGQVLYQNLGGVWYYVAGTFWGTLSPDQRPTDLGASDAGFEFRSVDTNPDLAPRTFVWSQAEWIETTLVMYGTHANRPAANEKTPPRTLYVEEDRGNVTYQQQANKWMYIAGTFWGTLSPDQRPTDLGVNDAGFTFRSTDPPARSFVWSQTAWVETTPATPVALLATATGALTLTATPTNIPGAALTLTNAGRYIVQGVFYFTLDATDAGAGATLIGLFPPVGTASVAAIGAGGAIPVNGTVTQQWLHTATAGAVITIQAYKSAGTGASAAQGSHTSISAIWLGP